MCEPAVPYVMWQLASPVTPRTATAPQPGMVAPLSVNATVPPFGVGAIVAVYVTCLAVVAGFKDDVNAVAVLIPPETITRVCNAPSPVATATGVKPDGKLTAVGVGLTVVPPPAVPVLLDVPS